MSTYVNQNRAGVIPVDLYVNSSVGAVTDATITVDLQEDGTSYFLDWDDLVFKAAGHVDQELTLPHLGNGTYSRAGGLNLGDTNLDLTSTRLTMHFDGSSPTHPNIDAYDYFELAPPHQYVPAISNTADPFALMMGNLGNQLGDVGMYTPLGGSAVQLKLLTDREPQRVRLAGGQEILVTMPTVTLSKADLAYAGGTVQKGDTWAPTLGGESWKVVQPPHTDNIGNVIMELANP